MVLALFRCTPMYFFSVFLGNAAFLFRCSLGQIIKIGKLLLPLLFKLRRHMVTRMKS